MLHKAKEVVDLVWRGGNNEWNEWKKQWALRHADNLKGCSCHMCCNPRRLGDLALQEKKFKEAIKCD